MKTNNDETICPKMSVDVQGKKYRLLVVDASSEQLERMKHDAALLPHGWRLGGEGEQVWRRGHERVPTIVLGSGAQRLQGVPVLLSTDSFPPCHALHYLQMATEKLGKAYAYGQSDSQNTHKVLVRFLRVLGPDRQAQQQLGFDRTQHWKSILKKSTELAFEVEMLAPNLAQDGPNPEYPWPRRDPRFAPAEHAFTLWDELREADGSGRNFLRLIERLFAKAEAYL